jgi:hypothetical protein
MAFLSIEVPGRDFSVIGVESMRIALAGVLGLFLMVGMISLTGCDGGGSTPPTGTVVEDAPPPPAGVMTSESANAKAEPKK